MPCGDQTSPSLGVIGSAEVDSGGLVAGEEWSVRRQSKLPGASGYATP